jgi:hypothetical protein
MRYDLSLSSRRIVAPNAAPRKGWDHATSNKSATLTPRHKENSEDWEGKDLVFPVHASPLKLRESEIGFLRVSTPPW